MPVLGQAPTGISTTPAQLAIRFDRAVISQLAPRDDAM